jgi:hypothetical protein
MNFIEVVFSYGVKIKLPRDVAKTMTDRNPSYADRF